MKDFAELEQAIEKGDEAFKSFIAAEKSANPDFLKLTFNRQGQQLTVLNYLIRKHNNRIGMPNRIEHIKWLLSNGADINLGQPVHLLLDLKKFDLFPLFVKFDQGELPSPSEQTSENNSALPTPLLVSGAGGEMVEVLLQEGSLESPQTLRFNARDTTGTTLLSRVIASGDISILQGILSGQFDINVNEPSPMALLGQSVGILPLHQATLSNSPEAIYALLEKGAVIDGCCGDLSETPLLYAARFGKIKSLGTLLANARTALDLEATNAEAKPKRPIDLLCERLAKGRDSQQALHGIAMLLCHGAAVPRDEQFRQLLMTNRIELLEEVKKYLAQSQHSATQFVRACHNKDNPLHDIIYAKSSWLQAIWRFFGLPRKEAFLVESLVFDGPPSAPKAPSQQVENGSDVDHGASSASLAPSPQGEARGYKFPPLGTIQRNMRLEPKKEAILEQSCLLVTEPSPAEFTREERSFAIFTWSYCTDGSYFFKRFTSTMQDKIVTGEYTAMQSVREYSGRFPNTRTRRLVNLMKGETPPMHHEQHVQGISEEPQGQIQLS